MIKELKEKFKNNDYMRFSERYIIISDYYSKDGTLLDNPNGAYTQNIQVVYDVVSISNTDQSKHSVLITDSNTTKFSKVVETVDVDEISRLIESIVISKLMRVNITFNGPSDAITITSGLLLKLFNFFKIVNIDIGDLEYNKTELPNGEFKLVGFNLSGGTTIVPQKFIMDVKDKLEIANTSIICEMTDTPLIQTIGKKVYLDRLNFTQPVKLIVGTPKQPNVDAFKETSVNLSYLNFDLSGFDDKDVSSANGVFVDPIINIESNVNTQIFNVELTGGDYRKFIKVSGVNEFSVSGLKRISKSVNAYCIGLDSIRTTKLHDINIYGEMASKLNACLIAFNSSSITVSDVININSIKLHNYGLVHLDSLDIKELLVYDCLFDGDVLLTSKNSNVSKLSFMNSNLSIDSDLSIEGNTIQLMDTTLISDKHDIKILSKGDVKITNTKIICDKNDIHIQLEDEGNVLVKDSDIYAKSCLIDKVEEDDSPLVNFMDAASVKRIKFDNTNLKLNGKFTINNIDKQIFNGIRFSNVSEVNITNSSLLSSQLFALDVDKSVPLNFNKVVFKDAMFASATSPTTIPVSLVDSSGDLSFDIKDSYNSDTSHCDIDLISTRSKLGCTFTSDSIDTRVKVVSSDCLGSCFFGEKNVTVVPEMKSKDIEYFKRTSEFVKQYDSVNYGNDE